ncbi:arylsulfotransferase family protein [Pseudomonadales bacterium]|nr:arylsulfotransferase family protein [Pseudomonadales bacterium]
MKNYRKLILLQFVIVFLLSSCGFSNNENDVASPPLLALSDLTVESVDNIFYPPFSADTRHYAASCGGGESISVDLVSLNQEAQIHVNDSVRGTGAASISLDGLTTENDIVIELTSAGYSEKYYIHCITSEFPLVEITTKTEDVDDGVMILSPFFENKGYLLILNNNGVPLFRRIIDGRVTDFKRHSDGRYSYALRGSSRNEFGHWDNTIVVLNAAFQEERQLKTVGLNHTDNHEFLITTEGTFILASYNSSYRDMRPWGLSEKELTRDSVIQELNDQGEVLFEWNSWDHIDVNNCLNHRFPDDYAHLNSIQVAPDGNLIASLRGCSMVVKIDRASGSGATIWDIGGLDPSLQIVGDSFQEFCGQHTASEDKAGNLYIFDNGGHCNGTREETSGLFSRALQYSLDLDAGQASFQRDYSLNSSYSEYTTSGGSFFPVQNGNWLINWSKGINDITEVSLDGNIELKFFLSSGGEKLRAYRVYRDYDLDLPINIDGELTFYRFGQ